MNVADLRPAGSDALGYKIVYIYAFQPPQFALYRTDQRLLIHFADDPDRSDDQRKSLAQLAPLRGEINGLVEGWRSAPDSGGVIKARLRSKAERYDRRSADALQVALEGDLTTATALLEKVKSDVLSERIGWSRFEYLATAFLAAVVIGLISIDAQRSCDVTVNQFLCLPEATDMWRGVIAGALGAFFSIALGIRGRTILPDLYRPANLMDALLRVVVGSIGGLVLVGLVRAGFVRFSLGDSTPGDYRTVHIFIVGFVAGFTERLVPDLLAKADARTGEPAITRQPEPKPESKEDSESAKAGAAGSDEQGAGQATDIVAEQAGEDTCVAELEIADDELTQDEDLPRASGGIEGGQGAE